MNREPRPEDSVDGLLQCLRDIGFPPAGAPDQKSIESVHPDWPVLELVMSNFDHRLDVGLESTLRGGQVMAQHVARHFHGLVWFADGLFHEEVCRYHKTMAHRSAATLEELMKLVNDEFGWE